MNLTPPSSMDFPSAAIEILVVVSGTRFRQTAIFTHPPREDWSGSGSAGAEGSKGGDWSLPPSGPHPCPLSRDAGEGNAFYWYLTAFLWSLGPSTDLPIFPD